MDDGNEVGLPEFVLFTQIARAEIPAGKTKWGASPFRWMLHHGPPTKSKMCKTIVKEWLKARRIPWGEAENGRAHFDIDGELCTVHLGMQGKDGKLMFANLREPGLGVDYILLLGVEPRRARMWKVLASTTKDFHHYSNDAEGYHSVTIDPEDVPDWAREVASWT